MSIGLFLKNQAIPSSADILTNIIAMHITPFARPMTVKTSYLRLSKQKPRGTEPGFHSGGSAPGRVYCASIHQAYSRFHRGRRPGKCKVMSSLLPTDTRAIPVLTAICIIQGMRLFILKKNKCLVNSISPSILHGMI